MCVQCGLRRSHGVLIICAYLAFAGLILTSAYSSTIGMLLWTALPVAIGIVLGAWTRRRLRMWGSCPAASRAGDDRSLVDGWSPQRLWLLALAISSIIAGIDAALGHHVVLIGLLIAGPCCALLAGRWGATASTGIWAIALAILLGLPDGIWGSWTHIAFLGAVVVVAAATTAAAAVMRNAGWHDRP